MHYYLITTHNHKAFIHAAVHSVIEQYGSEEAFAKSAKVFILDDASCDGTDQALDALRVSYPNVRTQIAPHNQGVAKNRNLLLSWALTQSLPEESYLIFMDGDDLLSSEYLRHKLKLFQKDPALEVVGGQMHLFYMDGSPAHLVDTFSTDPEIQEIASLFENHFYLSNAMFRADIFKNPTLRFPEVPALHDWLFFALHPLHKRHAEEVTLLYRRHAREWPDHIHDPLELSSLRQTAHRLWALRIGYFLTEDECNLLDLVGYLSFRLRLSATTVAPVNCHMAWFKWLKDQPRVCAYWPELRAELRALFRRLLHHNARIPVYNAVKLKRFFEALLVLADKEVMAASTLQVGAAALKAVRKERTQS